MKKTVLVFVFLTAALYVTAQRAGLQVPASRNSPALHPQYNLKSFSTVKNGQQAKSALVDEFWLSYASSIDQLNGGGPGSVGPALLSSNYLFPDSLCYGEFGAGNFAPVWIHHLGDILDVKSAVFNLIDGVTWDATTTYSVDSVSRLYSYTRTESVTDTLIITLLTNNIPANMPGYYFTGTTAANYNTDTLSFRGLKYYAFSNTINAAGVYKFKVPLTDADTAISYFRELQCAVPVPFVVPAGKLLGIDIQFKPGYSYALGDSIDYQHNAFFFTSYEEFGAGTYPTYQDCDMLSEDCDYNCSFIIPQDVRYNMAGTWNGLFIPSWAYTVDYAFEHHLISYKVTSPPLGTSVNEHPVGNFALLQNQPNPFTGRTTLSYQLNNSANEATVEIVDIRGVKMFEKTQYQLNPGKYVLEVETGHFSAGIYFCTLTVDGEKTTTKMVAQ